MFIVFEGNECSGCYLLFFVWFIIVSCEVGKEIIFVFFGSVVVGCSKVKVCYNVFIVEK